jgi:hypothetical protein
MSTRAIASQRNKRTAIPSASQPSRTPPAPTSAGRVPNPSPVRRELSVQEAFSLVNNKIRNIEKAVFEGDFTRPENTDPAPDPDQIQDIYTQLDELRLAAATPPPNPYTSLNTATSFDTINAELLMMKNDVMSTRNAVQRIDGLSAEIADVKASIGSGTGSDTGSGSGSGSDELVDKVASIDARVSELKDMIINLQNFTLQINDTHLREMALRTSINTPDLVHQESAQYDTSESIICSDQIVMSITDEGGDGDECDEEQVAGILDRAVSDAVDMTDSILGPEVPTETEVDVEAEAEVEAEVEVADEPEPEPDTTE